jgi:hypothetical protein
MNISAGCFGDTSKTLKVQSVYQEADSSVEAMVYLCLNDPYQDKVTL